MNLTQQQVYAISDMVELKENKAYEDKVKAAKPTPAQVKKCKELAKKEYAKYMALPDYIRKNTRGNYNNTPYQLSHFENWVISHCHPTPVKPSSKNEKLNSKIIVTAMGCKTIDELKKKLNVE